MKLFFFFSKLLKTNLWFDFTRVVTFGGLWNFWCQGLLSGFWCHVFCFHFGNWDEEHLRSEMPHQDYYRMSTKVLLSFSVTHCCWKLESLVLEPSWFMCLSTVWGGMEPQIVMAWDPQQHSTTSSTLGNHTVPGVAPLRLDCPQNCRTTLGSFLPETAAIFPNNSIVWKQAFLTQCFPMGKL